MIKYFKFIYDTKVKLTFLTEDYLDKFVIKNNKKIIYKSNINDLKKKEFIFDIDFNICDKYELVWYKSNLDGREIARYYDLYDTSYFDKYNVLDTLGALYSKDYTVFRVWSPISNNIKLRLYNTGTPKKFGGDDNYREFDMVKDERGLFSLTINEDLDGKYYTYYVSNQLYKEEVVDPYAKSTGINGLRGMVVNFEKINTKEFNEMKIHEVLNNNMVVYESHIADLTSSKTWNGPLELSKTFKGFYYDNTSYKGMKTGFSHIKELGVNFVQLLPIFDAKNDERINKRKFNWGYNPQNYNSLDGIYSTNPYDGYEKIKEFKELVLAYNKAGINIIMDVVYNHVNDIRENPLEVIMPDYYFRVKNGKYLDASACGNETASNRFMYRKFMVDSCLFWASEYKLAGFRFDLMGIHDTVTMEEISNKLHELNPYIKVYGEPWAASEVKLNNLYPANQANIDKFNGYGCFNDKIRDALIKGGLNSSDKLGFVSNDIYVEQKDFIDLVNGIKGFITGNNELEKTVNYATCHDNYTLYDRLKAAKVSNVKARALLANSIILTSKGISFILSGEEMLRTKKGEDNSYNLSYKINEIDYNLKLKHQKLFECYKKLINLKENILDEELIINSNTNNSTIYYELKTKDNTYLVIHHNGINSNNRLDLEGYKVYLDTSNITKELTSNYKLNKFQTLILYK